MAVDEEKANEENDSDENDSFYAVGDDDDDEGGDQIEDSEDYETSKLSDSSLKNYMTSMDEELREKKGLSRLEMSGGKGNRDEQELDIDLNLVTNALESYSSQLGLTGPVSNILKSLGI